MIRRLAIRLPVAAAAAIIAAAYVGRSVLLRGGDFSADTRDVLVLLMAAAVLLAVAAIRRTASRQPGERPASEGEHEDRGPRDEG